MMASYWSEAICVWCCEASMLALTEGQRLRGLIAISGIYSGPRFYRNWLTRHMPPALRAEASPITVIHIV